MKNIISPDPISLTTHHFHMCFKPTDLVISSGTGFIYVRNNRHYLITNWHNVAGKDPQTLACISGTGAIPDLISTLFRLKGNPGNTIREYIPLYKDNDFNDPLWKEHPVHKQNVDVVAIELSDDLKDKYDFYAINAVSFDDIPIEVADEIFIVGYPFFDTTYLQMPIWKKGSIASEPDININQLPKFLVDTATRSGLSGSPVIMQRIGIHGMKGGVFKGHEKIGRVRNFAGIYSGRIGDDELKAQLGIVWKARVINEIIDS